MTIIVFICVHMFIGTSVTRLSNLTKTVQIAQSGHTDGRGLKEKLALNTGDNNVHGGAR